MAAPTSKLEQVNTRSAMAESILDFSKELDVSLLEQVVQKIYTGSGSDRQNAQELLTVFQDNEDAWTRVDCILERSNDMQTKFFALQILEKFVQTRWNSLVQDSRSAIRNFVVNDIVKVSSDEGSLHQQRTYLSKLNQVLVEILKQEWPRNWPNFIPEIVESSRSNVSLCENNMKILKLLSEEIFDFSSGHMTQLKTKNLRKQLCDEFSQIYHLCKEVLDRSEKPSLIKATLSTLLRFLNWIPVTYIFDTDLINVLCVRFFEVPTFRNVTLKCITEIANLDTDASREQQMITLFTAVMTTINKMIPPDTDIANIYENSKSDDDQEFVQNMALFLTTFLSKHLKTVERSPTNHSLLINGHYYLIKISNVDDREIFKICLEYWAKLVQGLFDETRMLSAANIGMGMNMFEQNGIMSAHARMQLYGEVLTNLRVVMIEHMAKPEEVLVVENDDGEIVRESMKESDTIILYKSMKEVLVYLTNLDVHNMEDIMNAKLAKQMDGSEWSWQNLNKLCWAIGSISGAMTEELEKRFLVNVIRDLLNLCEMKHGKDNKAVVASNIMYTVGQYPRFLKAHWKFLKTVVTKLFEFMHESHEGVQDMACDTFIKIAQKCKRHFVVLQHQEKEPFIFDILRNINKHTSDLQPQQIHTFYEALGYMISAARSDRNLQEQLISEYMSLPNSAWSNTMNLFSSNQDDENMRVLNDANNVKVLVNVLKTNVSACISAGPAFIGQIGEMFKGALALYTLTGKAVQRAIEQQGEIALKTPKLRGLRTVKKEILRLMNTYVEGLKSEADGSSASVRESYLDMVNTTLVDPFLASVLQDYAESIDMAREAETLNVIATLVNRLGSRMLPRIQLILQASFEPTLKMITKDFTEYPEHRSGFYNMLRAINLHCFGALLELSSEQFKLFIHSLIWGFKHTMRDIADVGLQICSELIGNMRKADPSIGGLFYQSYYLAILQDIFFVLTDRDHKSGFKGQTEVLGQLIELVATNHIQAPLYPPNQASDPGMNNIKFMQGYLMELLQNAFPHLQSGQIKLFVNSMFEFYTDLPKFKSEVRDFLIQLKEFSGENTDLYLEEKEADLERARKAEREKALSIPGMVKPSELPTMEEDEML